MELLRKISSLLVAATFATSLSAQSADCYIKKAFPASPGTLLRLSNKYGDINVFTGTGDSLYLCATITILHNDKEMVRQSINLITIDIKKLNDTVTVSTLYDKKFFSDSYRKGRQRFSVDYTVTLPLYSHVSITNAFGNVSLEEVSGTVEVLLSQGTLSARKLTRGNNKPLNSVRVDHGKISIDTVNWLSLSVRNCPLVSIVNAQALLINSNFSKIKISKTNSLVSDSKSDSYNIGTINNLVTESLYSTFEINELYGKFISKTIYGSLSVFDLKKDFSYVDINSTHTPIMINTGEGASFVSDVMTTNSLVEFSVSDNPYLVKTDNFNNLSFTGIAGIDKETKSVLKIRTSFGKLSIH